MNCHPVMCAKKNSTERAYGKYKRSVAWQYKKRADRSQVRFPFLSPRIVVPETKTGQSTDSGDWICSADYDPCCPVVSVDRCDGIKGSGTGYRHRLDDHR